MGGINMSLYVSTLQWAQYELQHFLDHSVKWYLVHVQQALHQESC